MATNFFLIPIHLAPLLLRRAKEESTAAFVCSFLLNLHVGSLSERGNTKALRRAHRLMKKDQASWLESVLTLRAASWYFGRCTPQTKSLVVEWTLQWSPGISLLARRLHVTAGKQQLAPQNMPIRKCTLPLQGLRAAAMFLRSNLIGSGPQCLSVLLFLQKMAGRLRDQYEPFLDVWVSSVVFEQNKIFSLSWYMKCYPGNYFHWIH